MKTNRTVVGVDTGKRVFQLHWVDMETGEIVELRLMRAKFLEHFANRAPCLVAMEACGGSQHWARRIRDLGHEVRLLPAKMVWPFVGGNKNDAHDARAIWTAVQQPGVKTVAIKSEEQQAILELHRMRQQLVGYRTAPPPLPDEADGNGDGVTPDTPPAGDAEAAQPPPPGSAERPINSLRIVRIQDQALRAFRQSRRDIRQAGHPQCVRISAPRTRAANPSPDARSAPSSRPACVRVGVIRRPTLTRRTLAMQNVSTPIGVE